jgi:hypothetical protein
MHQAGDDGREFCVAADADRYRVRDGICGSHSKLPELIRAPTVGLAMICQRADMIGAGGHVDEANRLRCRRRDGDVKCTQDERRESGEVFHTASPPGSSDVPEHSYAGSKKLARERE